MSRSDELRRGLMEPGCTCAWPSVQLRAALEGIALPPCPVHDADELAAQEHAKTRDAIASAHGALRELQDQAEQAETEQADEEPAPADPLAAAIALKVGVDPLALNASAAEIAAHHAIPVSQDDDEPPTAA